MLCYVEIVLTQGKPVLRSVNPHNYIYAMFTGAVCHIPVVPPHILKHYQKFNRGAVGVWGISASDPFPGMTQLISPVTAITRPC